METEQTAMGSNTHSYPSDARVCCECGIPFLTEEQKKNSHAVTANKGKCCVCGQDKLVVPIAHYNYLYRKQEPVKPSATVTTSPMSTIKITGKLIKVFPTELRGEFAKRIIWLEELVDRYANTWQLELWKDDVKMGDAYNEGDTVTCSVDLRGRYWHKPAENKEGVMNTLKCWNIEKDGKSFKVFADPAKRQAPVNTGTGTETFDADNVPF